MGLAKAVDRLNSGPYRHLSFTREQIREIRYASLLHDFGKVGVREEVLVKAKKLYPNELELLRWRFHYVRKDIQIKFLQKKLELARNEGRAVLAEREPELDAEMQARLNDLAGMLRTIEESNEPSVLEEGNYDLLQELSQRSFFMDDGTEIPFLKENELFSLSVRRGTLNQNERMEIESHVSHTYRFLIQIPWTGDLRGVPDIAHGHHEKLDGSGYPLGLKANQIAVQPRMMTIADIYDALTASDRPYKKALNSDFAIKILNQDVDAGRLDRDLMKIFVEAEVYRKTMPQSD